MKRTGQASHGHFEAAKACMHAELRRGDFSPEGAVDRESEITIQLYYLPILTPTVVLPIVQGEAL